MITRTAAKFLYVLLFAGINQDLLDSVLMPTDRSEVSDCSIVGGYMLTQLAVGY